MTTRKGDRAIAQKIEITLTRLSGPLPVQRQPVIGDMAYLYVRCARFRKLLDDLLARSPTPNLRDSIEREFYTILAEIQNINLTTKDLGEGLEEILEELPNDSG